MLEWHWPWVGLLLPLPWLVRIVLPAYLHQQEAIRVPFFKDLVQSAEKSVVSAPVPAFLLVVLWLSLLVAAARPVWFGEPVNIATSGRDLMLAIDISDSMRIDDMQTEGEPSMRIDIVKSLAAEFIDGRVGDRVGLILFGQQAYLQTPLTFDHRAVIGELQQALPGFAGSSTAIGDAIGMAINLLRDRPTESRVLILLSDGSNTYGTDPLNAVVVASEADIRIHTIGLGALSHVGTDVIGRAIEVNPSKDLDEQVLMGIAQSSGGTYFRAHNPGELSRIYQKIDELEPAAANEYARPQRSLYHWPLAVALFCGMLLIAIKDRY